VVYEAIRLDDVDIAGSFGGNPYQTLSVVAHHTDDWKPLTGAAMVFDFFVSADEGTKSQGPYKS
jgi:hypothetical protein